MEQIVIQGKIKMNYMNWTECDIKKDPPCVIPEK